jgi:DNA-binding transcriptional regulator YiaG
MMTDEQRSKVAALKAAIAASTPTAGGAPQEVRAAALALKRELRREGTTARVLAAALGIHETTLCRWEQDRGASRGPEVRALRGDGRGASFREVRVAAPEATPAQVVSAAVTTSMVPSLRVAHAPSGLVIDGLDVETLAELLRRMS